MKRFLLIIPMFLFSFFVLQPVVPAETYSGGYEMAKITATSEITRILKEKDAGITGGIKSIRSLLSEVQKQVQAEISTAAIGSWDAFHLPQIDAAIQEHIDNWKISSRGQADDLIDNAWSGGTALVNAPLAASGELVLGGFGISSSTLDVMKNFTFHKLDNVAESAMDKIRSELSLGILGGKTPHEVSVAIGNNLKDPSIFRSIHARANVITHTELSRVFDSASHERMKVAAESVDGLKKEWRHDGHPKKPRSTHLAAHGQIQEIDKPFEIGSVLMMFPHDPAAPLEEVINCTCSHLPYMEKWKS